MAVIGVIGVVADIAAAPLVNAPHGFSQAEDPVSREELRQKLEARFLL